MSEKDWQEEAVRLLSCQYPSCNGERYPDCTRLIDCAAHHRPAVAAALEKAAEDGAGNTRDYWTKRCKEQMNRAEELRAEVARLRERLQIRIDTVDGIPTGIGEDEIDRLTAERNAAAEKFGRVVAALRKDIDTAVVQGLEISEDTARHFRTDIDFTGIANIHAATCELIANAIAAEIAKRTTKGENK